MKAVRKAAERVDNAWDPSCPYTHLSIELRAALWELFNALHDEKKLTATLNRCYKCETNVAHPWHDDGVVYEEYIVDWEDDGKYALEGHV